MLVVEYRVDVLTDVLVDVLDAVLLVVVDAIDVVLVDGIVVRVDVDVVLVVLAVPAVVETFGAVAKFTIAAAATTRINAIKMTSISVILAMLCAGKLKYKVLCIPFSTKGFNTRAAS